MYQSVINISWARRQVGILGKGSWEAREQVQGDTIEDGKFPFRVYVCKRSLSQDGEESEVDV